MVFLAAWFLAPLFALAGAILIAIPILIHILNRRRYKIVNWAAMDFLLKAMRKNRRRLRFEQFLLLATRCLLLALLGLALARPTGCTDRSIAGITGERNSLHVLVIDNSYSMAYQAGRPEARTHLDQAKKLAKAVIARLSSGGESVAIVTAARPAGAAIVKPTYDLSGAVAAIERIEQSYSSTDLPGALTLAVQIGRDDPRQVPKHLDLFTDATRSAWEIPQADALGQLGLDAAKIFRVRHFSLGLPGQWNRAVLDLRPAGNLVTTRFGSDLLATARGFGPNPPTLLQWKLDDASLPAGTAVQFDPQSPPIIQSQAAFRTGGAHLAVASLVGDDPLPIDNIRYRAIDVASELKLLIVEGERAPGALGSSGAFLQLALAPPRDGAGHSDSYIAPELISDLELPEKPLADYRAVILCGVGQIQPTVADQLQRFVQQGGTLLVAMGESVNADNYNQVLVPRKLLPGNLVRRMNAAADGKGFTFDFNPQGVLHPLLNIFRGEEKSGLDTVQVFSYWQLELPANSPAERILNYVGNTSESGALTRTGTPAAGKKSDPAITVHTLGNGRVVFFSTTLNADWTSFPAKLAYLSLMHELIGGTIAGGDQWMNRTVGQIIQLPPTLRLTAAPMLSDVNQNSIPLPMQTSDGQAVYRTTPIEKPGVYTLNTGSSRIPIAVNLPDDEADVRTLDGSAIRRALGQINLELLADQLPPESAAAVNEGRDFGWNVMLLVLALAGLECFLAMRFGHRIRK